MRHGCLQQGFVVPAGFDEFLIELGEFVWFCERTHILYS